MFISSGRLHNELLHTCYWRDDGLVVSVLAYCRQTNTKNKKFICLGSNCGIVMDTEKNMN